MGWTPASSYSANLLRGCKRNIQPRGKYNVILLLARGRISHINVAELILPTQPLADFCHGAQVKCSAILLGVAQVRIEVQFLRHNSAGAKLVRELFPQSKGGEFAGERKSNHCAANRSGIALPGIVNAAEQIECGFIALDGVKTQADSHDRAKIQSLQRIAHEITTHKCEKPWIEIAIVADSSLHQVSDSAWARSRRIVLRVYSARVHGDFVIQCGMHGVESYCQVLGLVIAPRQRKADISPAIPAMQQSRMQRFVVGCLLRVVADYRHVFIRSLDRAASL